MVGGCKDAGGPPRLTAGSTTARGAVTAVAGSAAGIDIGIGAAIEAPAVFVVQAPLAHGAGVLQIGVLHAAPRWPVSPQLPWSPQGKMLAVGPNLCGA